MRMHHLLVLPVCILTCNPALGQQPVTATECVVLSESAWKGFAPAGKEVDAIFGDVVLRNARLTAVIAQPLATRHANMTVHDVGGGLIDLTSRGFESDQLGAFYPGAKEYPFRRWVMVGPDGAARALPEQVQSGSMLGVRVEADGDDAHPAVSVTYQLASDAPFLSIATTYTNHTGGPLMVPLADSLRADGGREDMQKSPNGAADMFWFDDRYWQQAYGFSAIGRQIQSNSSSRDSTLKYVDETQSSSIELAPGESFELTRRVSAGRTLMHVQAALANDPSTGFVPVTLNVVDDVDRPLKAARVEVHGAGGQRGTVRADDAGRATVPLSPGAYSVRVSVNGVAVAEEVPLVVDGTGEPDRTIKAAGYQPGTLIAKIVDEQGRGIPCKVDLKPQGETPLPDFGPDTGEFAVRNLRYAPHGEFSQDLHAGTYDVIVSHGPEYDAIFTEVTVKPGEETLLAGTLVRSVDTTGWISSDFHSHSTPSGDNTSSQLGRVLNLVCEHIEFAPCTEHNRIDTYVPHIEQLKIEPFMGTCSGIELTGSPLPLNHQNAFPLHHHPHHQDGGAPVTDVDPERQIERLALWDDRSDKLIQQNHPDIGWLFYDRDGDGQPDEGFSRSFGLIDVMEVHPLADVIRRERFVEAGDKRYNNRVFNWLQLLNQGHRIPGVVNTDAHYNFHESGVLRNWVESPTDRPAEVKTLEVVHAAEHGHLVMSNGPFLEVKARTADSRDLLTAGDDLTAPDGKVELQIRVQCPNWHDINRVFILVNGRLLPKLDFRRETHTNQFAEGTAKFDQSVPVLLDSDAHLIIVACGEGLQLGPVQGPTWGAREPTAVSNPLFVDVDGNGFKPNQDTLDHPLPVRRD